MYKALMTLPVLLCNVPLLFTQFMETQPTILNIELPFHASKNKVLPTKFALYQNQPNPFKNETAISFVLPRQQKVALIIMDVIGKVISRREYLLNDGYQEVTIGDVEIRGVLYYQLRTEDGLLATRRMIAE
jgi:hypothetical protein